jgi:hypothetical protein
VRVLTLSDSASTQAVLRLQVIGHLTALLGVVCA